MIIDGSSIINVTLNTDSDPVFIEVDRVYVGKLSLVEVIQAI